MKLVAEPANLWILRLTDFRGSIAGRRLWKHCPHCVVCRNSTAHCREVTDVQRIVLLSSLIEVNWPMNVNLNYSSPNKSKDSCQTKDLMTLCLSTGHIEFLFLNFKQGTLVLTGCMWGNISNPLGSAGGHWGRKFQTPSPLGSDPISYLTSHLFM